MRRPLLVLSSAFLLLTLLCTTFAIISDTDVARADAPNDEFAFIDLLNQHRADAGLPGLTMSAGLSDYARAHSQQMAAAGSIFHSSNLSAIAGAVAPNWRTAGENVGVGGSVSVLDTALMNSAPHRANILGAYNYVGIGVAYNGNRVFVTEMFVATTTPITARSRPGSSPPIGSVDAISRFQSQLSIDGWAIDPDTSSSIAVHVYVDGAFATATTANGSRPDLASLGRGTSHGFHTTVNLGPGLHSVCVFGINNAAGVNPAIGCRSVNMMSWPLGAADVVAQSGDGIVAAGWALDPDTASSIDVHMYLDGQRVAVATADDMRPDIGSAYPGYGSAHGYSVRTSASPGWHSVCVWAINVGPGGSPQLPCRSVYVASNPFGSIDVASPGPGDLDVAGWLIDPSSTSPITGHLYIDGQFAGATTSSLTRPDVAGLGFGSAHGYDMRVAIDGGLHQVCVFGINVGAGANTPVRCVATVVQSDPVGAVDAVAIDATPSGATSRGAVPTRVAGWAIDPNTAASIDVRVVIDGAVATTVDADISRPDLARYYPGFGTRHGYSASVTVTPGLHNVCAVAVNSRAGTDRLLGCRVVGI
jgi:hypothetical protein